MPLEVTAKPTAAKYQLTDVGRSLIKPLSALSASVQQNQPAIEAARASQKSGG
jgi:DNA-binding HxlR family transcriptional regulator